jgi:hypothetical protein
MAAVLKTAARLQTTVLSLIKDSFSSLSLFHGLQGIWDGRDYQYPLVLPASRTKLGCVCGSTHMESSGFGGHYIAP